MTKFKSKILIKAFRKSSVIIVTLLIVFAFLLALFFCTFPTLANAVSKRELPIYSVDREKKIAISFDCAWGVDYTDGLLSVMKEKNINCTFFAVEFWVEKYPEYAKKIVDYGNELGTHSSTHPYMTRLSKESIVSELTTSVNAIEKVTGQKVTLFRAPYGDYNDKVILTAKELGLFTVQWDVDSLDWKNLSANEIVERVTGKVKDGSIILCHNQGLHTLEALPTIIDKLKEKGFEFVKISELIYKDDYYLSPDGKQHENKKI